MDTTRDFHWLACPKCGAKTKIKLYEDTVLLHFPMYCSRCKEEIILGVIKYKTVANSDIGK